MRRLLVVGLFLTVAVLLAHASASAETNVKVGVLKLTSSARPFLAWRRASSASSGSRPSSCTSRPPRPSRRRSQPASSTSGATGLTAGALQHRGLGGQQLWIVADKGREWPNHNLTALVVRKDLYDGGVRSMRDLGRDGSGRTRLPEVALERVLPGRHLDAGPQLLVRQRAVLRPRGPQRAVGHAHRRRAAARRPSCRASSRAKSSQVQHARC